MVPPATHTSNAFEKTLADEGTTILKFFLHISKEEQRQRLQARLDTPEKNWKIRKGRSGRAKVVGRLPQRV